MMLPFLMMINGMALICCFILGYAIEWGHAYPTHDVLALAVVSITLVFNTRRVWAEWSL